jgi:hypothetical protein
MIKFDLSKAISPRFGTYLLGLVPGVFFEASIAIAEPHFAASVIYRVREVYFFGPYALLLLFFTSSLFIGEVFFVAAWIVQLLMFSAFVSGRFAFRSTLGSQWLYHWFGKVQGVPPKQTIIIRLLSRLIFWARRRVFSLEARPVLTCLHRAAKRLLEKKYGIRLSRAVQLDEGEWQVWCSTLGKPPKWFGEAVMMQRTFAGCGLAGLAALYASHALRERYFIAFCSLVLFTGIFLTFDLARWNFNPFRRSLLQLKSVLVELSEASAIAEEQRQDSENNLSAEA